MTSRSVANALLHELTYFGGGTGSANVPTAFTLNLDFDAELVWPDLPFDTSSPLARYPTDERPEVREIVASVGRLTGTRAPKALTFINEHMKTALVCRSDAIDAASSASNREHVGACVLTNMHAPANRVLVCIEALVHESIHQYLYKTELGSGNFCDLSESRTYRSPWTGARIPLHSLIHAALVWYGLLTLWCQLAHSAENSDEALYVRDKAARVLFGFAFIRQMLSSPAFPTNSVQPQIIELIDHVAGFAHLTANVGTPDCEQRTLHDSLQFSEGGAWIPQLSATLLRVENGWR